jgi:hypothetical protein
MGWAGGGEGRVWCGMVWDGNGDGEGVGDERLRRRVLKVVIYFLVWTDRQTDGWDPWTQLVK